MNTVKKASVGPSRKERTRQSLVQAAERVFRDKGLQSTTVEMILVEAGAARATFYAHFTDKNDLVRVILADVWERAGNTYGDFARLASVDRVTLRAWLVTVREAWHKHYSEIELLLRDIPDEIEADSERHMIEFVALVVGDGARWACPVEQARCRAHLLIGQLERGLLEVHRGTWSVDEELLLDTLATLWDHAMHEA